MYILSPLKKIKGLPWTALWSRSRPWCFHCRGRKFDPCRLRQPPKKCFFKNERNEGEMQGTVDVRDKVAVKRGVKVFEREEGPRASFCVYT